jgi:hypothetical protein
VLDRNLTASGDCIIIAADFVTLDLAGFVIRGETRRRRPGGIEDGPVIGGSSGSAVTVAPEIFTGTVIRNGTITGLKNGVYMGLQPGVPCPSSVTANAAHENGGGGNLSLLESSCKVENNTGW